MPGPRERLDNHHGEKRAIEAAPVESKLRRPVGSVRRRAPMTPASKIKTPDIAKQRLKSVSRCLVVFHDRSQEIRQFEPCPQ
jgi:hypothetical protein